MRARRKLLSFQVEELAPQEKQYMSRTSIYNDTPKHYQSRSVETEGLEVDWK